MTSEAGESSGDDAASATKRRSSAADSSSGGGNSALPWSSVQGRTDMKTEDEMQEETHGDENGRDNVITGDDDDHKNIAGAASSGEGEGAGECADESGGYSARGSIDGAELSTVLDRYSARNILKDGDDEDRPAQSRIRRRQTRMLDETDVNRYEERVQAKVEAEAEAAAARAAARAAAARTADSAPTTADEVAAEAEEKRGDLAEGEGAGEGEGRETALSSSIVSALSAQQRGIRQEEGRAPAFNVRGFRSRLRRGGAGAGNSSRTGGGRRRRGRRNTAANDTDRAAGAAAAGGTTRASAGEPSSSSGGLSTDNTARAVAAARATEAAQGVAVHGEGSNTEGGEGAAPVLNASVRAPQPPSDLEGGGKVREGAGEDDIDDNGEDALISAVLVDNDDVVEATPFVEDKSWTRRRTKLYAFAVLIVSVAIVVGLSVGLTRGGGGETTTVVVEGDTLAPTMIPSSSPTFDPRPTLQSIKDDGVLRCGVPMNPWFIRIDDATGRQEGFSVDMCRAIAAAVMGNTSYAIETTTLAAQAKWASLTDHSIDVHISATTHTMRRDVYEPTTKRGYDFTVPFFYGGLQAAGIPEYVDCVEAEDRYEGNCSKLKVCVVAGTTHVPIISEQVPGYMIELVQSSTEFPGALTNGTCNIILGELVTIAEENIRKRGYTGEYRILDRMFSKEPLAMVTREDDPEWSAFVDFVLQGLMRAQARNISQAKSGSDELSNVPMFDGRYPNALVDAISVVGHFGEVYERSFPPTTMNQINRGNSGLIYSFPFGSTDDAQMQNPGPNSTLSAIRVRGVLRCGISLRNGFGEKKNVTTGGVDWTGLDVTYCRALAAAIFHGSTRSVEFVPVDHRSDRFAKLAAGDIDVLSGCSLDMSKAEPNANFTGEGFSFSQPYFYQPYDSDHSTRDLYHALGTRQDDPQWSDFVFWVVSATFYAAERDLSKRNYNQMPTVDLFGPDLNWMLKDVIRRVGSYDIAYAESGNYLNTNFTRNGTRNEINNAPHGPQYYPLTFRGSA